MHYRVRKESTYNLPKYIIGDHKGSLNEWVTWVEYVDVTRYQDPSEFARELKFFFDVEHEAEQYRRDLEKLISVVLKYEKERVERKLKELLSL